MFDRTTQAILSRKKAAAAGDIKYHDAIVRKFIFEVIDELGETKHYDFSLSNSKGELATNMFLRAILHIEKRFLKVPLRKTLLLQEQLAALELSL